MTEPFQSGYSSGVSYTAVPVTKSDSTAYDPPLRWLDVGTGGDVTFIDGRGTSKTLTVGDGYAIKCLITKVMSTGTTASGFIGYP